MADNDSELDHTEGSSKHESFIEEPLRWCVVCGYILTGLTLAVLISSAWVLTPYLMQVYQFITLSYTVKINLLSIF